MSLTVKPTKRSFPKALQLLTYSPLPVVREKMTVLQPSPPLQVPSASFWHKEKSPNFSMKKATARPSLVAVNPLQKVNFLGGLVENAFIYQKVKVYRSNTIAFSSQKGARSKPPARLDQRAEQALRDVKAAQPEDGGLALLGPVLASRLVLRRAMWTGWVPFLQHGTCGQLP